MPTDAAQQENEKFKTPKSARRLWTLRLAAIALSLAPLMLLELALRFNDTAVVEAVDADPLVDLHQLRPLFELDGATQRWQVPAERLNFFQPASFVGKKPAGLRRVFVLGGSTVQGRPYATETAFSSWLQLRLQAACPDGLFEVVNCGGVSYASYRVSKIMEEVLQHQPDAIVLYTGHNEFLEHREYAEVREMGRTRRWVASLAGQLKVIKWLQTKLPESASPRTTLSGEVDAQLDHAGGLDRYTRDSEWRAGVEHHFTETLERMIKMASAANVPLVLCVPAGDLLNTPPFKVESILEPGTPEQKSFDASWAKLMNPMLSEEERLIACRTCLTLDPHHAGANYIAGVLLYGNGDLEPARDALIAARDHDVCPLRATSQILDSVVRLAQVHDVPLVNAELLFDQRDHSGQRVPDGIVDPRFFVDHVHPSIVGHQLIGKEIFIALLDLGWCDGATDQQKRYEALAEEHLQSLGEEYYARGKQRLAGLRRWAAGRAAEQIDLQVP